MLSMAFQIPHGDEIVWKTCMFESLKSKKLVQYISLVFVQDVMVNKNLLLIGNFSHVSAL